jgi:zinc transporter 7
VLAAWLNLIADFTHNLTDGIALASSFFISRHAGAASCLALFCHEVPHQFGDFALLIKGGFSKPKAFVTALGAYAGSALGVVLNKWAAAGTGGFDGAATPTGLFGTNVRPAELIMPATAGGFIYIATVGIIPDMLQARHSAYVAALQFLSALVGFGVMLIVSLNE